MSSRRQLYNVWEPAEKGEDVNSLVHEKTNGVPVLLKFFLESTFFD